MNDNQTAADKGYILLVDDQPENLRLLSTLLSERGYEPRGVINGKMAIKAAKSSQPDLILLDIMMPEMDGYEICEQLKAEPKTREIPVIFISAKDETIDKVRAFGLGAVDYIPKPFHVDEVLARIENHLSLRKLQKQLKEQNALFEQEIMTRQQTEQALQKANQELAKKNSELEQFAYVTSHDLQAPLATIASYAELLQQNYKSNLDSQANEYIQYIVTGCLTMQNLIEDLLEYSRIGRNQKALSLVDIKSIIDKVCRNLKSTIHQNKATIIYQDLPTVMADGSQLLQLFQNLIDNSIKYRREELPKIEISVESRENEYLFIVNDNGIGIDSKYFERIFQMFQRLHSTQDYSGTGIGLAICQKIVELHGGRIWVESQLGKGTTFYFTINSQNP
ncbi:hybrid sensor histidine kinase/response regulator [[Phormidium ambiguum] IAM M-71]|uniref:histidine kinase n=1 Tax=[Phormidium ambiguum] IAM M-71 TaxID=454136 RepID=A0A1U7IA04_9CYAN|nr:response regulator [Phormidium ambiguum]OKH33380.1 hybrid sensor histidine kinase/response regulator [Phormidium ambiguum IAM M-71]